MRGQQSYAGRRLVVNGLAGAMVASIGAVLTFYVLYATLPSYQGTADNLAWYATHSIYSLGFDIGIFAASVFGMAFIVAAFPKLAFAFSFFSLNLLFAWSSRVLRMVSQPLALGLSWMSSPQNRLVWDGLYFARLTPYLRTFAGLEGLLLIGLLLTSAFKLSSDRGAFGALLVSVQAAAACLVILGAEIAIFDNHELFLHVSNFQVFVNFIPWFNNADVLVLGVATLALTTLISRIRLR